MTMQTEAPVAQALAPSYVEPEHEFFDWAGMSFNVKALNAAIATGKVRPTLDTIALDFIKDYSERLLALKKATPDQKAYGLFIAVDGPRANQMPLEVLAKPVIFAYVGKKKGVLNLDGTGAHYVLIDGNHRMAKAYFSDTPALPAMVLSQSQIRAFRC